MAELYAGLMSGTSADGIDGCLARFSRGRTEVLGHRYRAYPDDLRTAVLAAMETPTLAEAADLDVRLADEAAALVADLLQATGHRAADVTAVGCHGQTLFHRPHGTRPASIQVCDPHRLAVRCGVDVVADFRRADLAAGGEGAPLAPAFHAYRFASRREPRAVLNIGGMANLTLLPADSAGVRGFDTGPGNVLLDHWCARSTEQPFDRDGALAAQGHVDPALLEICLDDPYFDRPAPKSTGREHFNGAWLDRHLAERAFSAEPPVADIQATLAELTTLSIARALQREAPATARVLVCGGGVRNGDLMQRLGRCLAGMRVESTAEHGLPPEQVEAVAFAWLARQRIRGRPGNLTAVTGATRSLVLGAHIRAPR